MSRSLFPLRLAAVCALGGAAALVGSATVTAAPIDFQPIPLECEAGLASVLSVTHDEEAAVGGDEVLYVVSEPGGGGAWVTWLNLDTGVWSNETLVSTQELWGAPAALSSPQAGTVVAAVWGPHENAAGEQCFLLPGVDIAQVPGVAPVEN
ncbi:hypothetical protein G4H71_09775 [Rhodococcus triatomae]|uniref:Uncharacterized protein n=1 Tax=Rhodococcus triatomae TaxID=300028 RepID=A0A1G8SP24_9NOCA|nr:hypothetical protein [Rhodococcus triatomae]QNG20801.1 hypothetical protein G4H72_20610 [Rhodococcus triatomae]QNG23284.1 hypothetical protein G4H71_09775 [Rhodococcus triatomae]SDJ30914.1 hypothetical protein SAMN05444695_1237 [Rhodococcus triatomae]